MIEILNTIDALSDQISALLELIQSSNEDCVDIKSIQVASEMCLTLHDELMIEVNKIQDKLKGQKEIVEDICTNYCKYPYMWNEEDEGCTLAESGICNKCPLNKLGV